jgi:hypothetical protein
MFMYCVYGDTILAEVVVLHLLFYTTSARIMSPYTQHMNMELSTNNFINI